MSDIHIVNNISLAGIWDDWLLLPTGALDESDELANLVKVALLTDRHADRLEILPDPGSTDRRGWWGDLEAETIWEGWPIGCKNWLLTRAKIVETANSFEGATLARAEEYTRSALQPMIDKKICSHIEVKAWRAAMQQINVTVKVFRGPKEEIELQFQTFWQGIREA